MDAGADVCVVSVHKMGAGFEQGSVFHLQGDLIDQDRLSACADLLMTTSPNVLVYAAMDGWRRQMVEHGHELLDAALRLADGVRADIELIPDLEVLDDELIGVEASHDLDRLQLMMDLSATGTSGYQAADWLRENKQVDMHLSDHRRICACLSFADDKSTTDRLLDALWAWRNAARDFDPPPKIDLPGLRADRRRTDHAVSARCPGRRAGRAARRRRHRLPAHGPRGGDDAARPGRPGTGKIPGGRMKLSGTPGFVYGGSGNITDR
jgi:lysine decarboxylase